jgi:Icc-related predicted phosphoesterase
VCGGERGTEAIGRSTIVAPGRLTEGQYAIADVHSRQVEFEELSAAARSG